MRADDGSELEALASRAAAGDRAAFRTIVDRTHVGAFRLALRIVGDRAEAEDVVQDSYLRAWTGMRSLRDGTAIRAWIYGIVRNVAASIAKARRRRAASSIEGESGDVDRLARYLVADDPLPDEAASAQQLRRLAQALVDQLDDKYRVPLLLRVVDGMAYEELADALGIPIGTVESRLFRARGKLAKKLRRAIGGSVRESA